METERLRWFLSVVKTGGVRPAAAQLRISASALSKALAGLESEIGHRLFERSPRGLTLTREGRFLEERAAALLRVEDTIREGFGSEQANRRISLFGSEPLVVIHLERVLALVRKRYSDAYLDVRLTADDQRTRAALEADPAALGLVSEVSRGDASLSLGSSRFGTFIGSTHPLAERLPTPVPVAEVVVHAFVVPDREVFGPREAGASADGWRDDIFPRRRRIGAPTQAIVRAFVESGHALAYLPLALGKSMNAHQLVVGGCPYSCVCDAHLVRSRVAPGWLRQLF